MEDRYRPDASHHGGNQGTPPSAEICPSCNPGTVPSLPASTRNTDTLHTGVPSTARMEPYLKKVTRELSNYYPETPTQEKDLQEVIDPSTLEDSRDDLKAHTRKMCFALHDKRTVTLGGKAAFVYIEKKKKRLR